MTVQFYAGSLKMRWGQILILDFANHTVIHKKVGPPLKHGAKGIGMEHGVKLKAEGSRVKEK